MRASPESTAAGPRRWRAVLLWAAAPVLLLSSACASRQPADSADRPAASAHAVTIAGAALDAPSVVRVADVPAPSAGSITQHDFVAQPHMVARLMRLAAGARIPEHHHAGYDESFVVLEGELALVLGETERRVRAGETVLIPAGTTIRGVNGAAESAAMVVWANTGRGGALTTPGPGRTSR